MFNSYEETAARDKKVCPDCDEPWVDPCCRACAEHDYHEQRERAEKAESQLAVVQEERDTARHRANEEYLARIEAQTALCAQQARLRAFVAGWLGDAADGIALKPSTYPNELSAAIDAPEPKTEKG